MNRGGMGRLGLFAVVCAASSACGGEDEARPQKPADRPLAVVSTETWDMCRLIGPAQHRPDVYGTDLGFSFSHPQANPGDPAESKVVLLFGDTMETAESVCDYPPRHSDDLQGALPGARPDVLVAGPPTADARNVCSHLVLPPPDPSKTSARPIRLFTDAGERSDDKILDTSSGKTPTGGFSDGKHAFAVFYRGESRHCDLTAECPQDLFCSADPAYTGKPLGECSPPFASTLDPLPAICRLDAGGDGDCGLHRTCVKPAQGVCLAAEPFKLATEQGDFVPPWYDEDPRRAVAQTLFIASAFWSDRPEDYALGARFLTKKFINPAFQTIAHFDPADPSRNDYRPGKHTLLMWGRPAYFIRSGFQALPFLLYQPLDGLLDADGHINWDPRYFAGYDADGKPRWSANEVEAQPIYGSELTIDPNAGISSATFTNPEFGLVNQMSLSFVEPLERWVMFYGGDLPKWLNFDPATNMELEPVHAQPVKGAIHMRYASHPWGRSMRDAPAAEAWTQPEPVLAPEGAAPYLGCADEPPLLPGCTPEHDPHRPLNFILTIDAHPTITESDWPEIRRACLEGDSLQNVTYRLSGDSTGHLYAADIIDAWSQDVTSSVSDAAPGERVVELYWHVSAWNPYQVALMKTELRARVR